MASSTFDFQAYLASLCPGEHFSISVLTGGLTNLTVRATRTSPAPGTSFAGIRNEDSFVLKYAPGYIAWIGDSFPFSQFRQVNLFLRDQHSLVDYRSASVRVTFFDSTFLFPWQEAS